MLGTLPPPVLPAAPPAAVGRGTILVVEDDSGVALLERRRLERAGYTAVTASTPEEALGRLRDGPVDLILLDYRLPGDADGLEFYQRVREAGFDPPVILVTGFGSEATVVRALRAGVRDFVSKSIEFLDYLPEAIDRVLRQVRTERKLAESEARLASVFESAIDAIIVANDLRRITLFNAAAEQMFRCRSAAAVGRPLGDFLPPEVLALIGTKTPHLVGAPLHAAQGRRATGEQFPLEASVSRAHAGGRTFYTAVVRDVTERQRLETQYFHAQRMESVGTLAGGVAHDFNNLLSIVNGYSELMLGSLPVDAPERAMVNAIREAGERAAGLTSQLLAFSRRQMLEPRVLDPNAVVAETAKMLRRLIGEDVLLTTTLGPRVSRVRVDPGQLGQVLMNLAINARDAMPRGGKLTVETLDITLDETYCQATPDARPGRHVQIAVTDTGVGMTPEVQARVFEPFFTTKPVGQGTGLGLATVYGIVRQSGGHVAVYSEVGVGTTFKVYLPAIIDATTAPLSDNGGIPRSGTETILLVEDEPGVRRIAKLALESRGDTVIEAPGGEAGLTAAAEHQGTIHLLVTDVVMPGMSGREVAEALRKQRPDTRVVYISGYTADAVIRHGILQAEVAFLQKPFTPLALTRKVREALDAPRNGGSGK